MLSKTWLQHWVRSISVRHRGSVDEQGNVTVAIWLRVPAKDIAEFDNIESMDRARREHARREQVPR